MTAPGSARAGRRFSWRFSWRGLASGAALAAAAVAVAAVIMPLGDAGTAAARPSSCGKAVGPFTVHGTKVLAKNSSVFISYGMTVSGLQEGNWTGLITADLAKIVATADDWCANTIRIQVNQDLLLGPNGTSFDPEYMAAIESEVSLAESCNLVVVLNDETNFSPPVVRHYQADPTQGTLVFWKDMTKLYGDDPQVIFDLYNEPRTSVPGMPDATLWRLWLNGGTFKHVDYAFGMAHLAAYVRYTAGARNLFWIEGPRYSLSFAGMVRYHALIHVSGVVYSIHHAQGQHDVPDWNAAFGYLVTDGIAPVVNGEFTNYEPLPNPDISLMPGYCWPNAPTAVPQYLQYLASLGIGISAYQLVPGWLIKSDKRLGSPTSMNPRTWSCEPDREPQPYQSAGALIMAYFEQHNG
ncbi:MAG TPA: cellulase family glycosylhydrolase [Streptosporangiaceae bacterium]|nr:cellulase family glycosylhydrolase [Streptosporangiaceae bacterium]